MHIILKHEHEHTLHILTNEKRSQDTTTNTLYTQFFCNDVESLMRYSVSFVAYFPVYTETWYLVGPTHISQRMNTLI